MAGGARALVAGVLLVMLLPGGVAAAPAAARTAGLATTAPGGGLVLLDLDPAFTIPRGPVLDGARAAVGDILGLQEHALFQMDQALYLSTFYQRPGVQPSPETLPAVTPVGCPLTRVRDELFSAFPDGAGVLHVEVTPRFFVPGPNDTTDVLVSIVVAHQSLESRLGLVELTVLQRLGPDESGRWWVFDWFVIPERQARLTWLVWCEGKVSLEPFEGRLQGEITYYLYPGLPLSGQSLSLILAESFTVVAVRGPNGSLAWERSGQNLRITLDRSPQPAASWDVPFDPTVVTVLYEGYVTPEGGRRGNLEYLGVEGIHLRPRTGWYPRLPGEGAVRGALTVTVPSWWAAVVPGRLTGHFPGSELASFTWSLDTPAELYLAAGPYNVRTRITNRGVTLRTFFYPLKDEFAPGYLDEAERILEFFSGVFRPYPYPNLSLVEVPRFYYGGLSARSFVILDKDWLFDPRVYAAARSLLAHEISHQWWGEMVPVWGDIEWFMWEGLATYCEALYAEARSGPGALTRAMATNAETFVQGTRGHAALSIAQANVRRESWHDRLIYEKGAWVFHTLRFLMGDQNFFELLQNYVDRFAGRSPGSADLERLIAEKAPDNPYLASYIDRWVRSSDEINLTVSSVSTRSTPAGGTSLSFTLTDRGDGFFPRAEIAFCFRGGGSETLLVEAGPHTLEFDRPVSRIIIDPNHWVLDSSRAGNSYRIMLGGAVSDAAVGTALRSIPALVMMISILLAARSLLRRKAAGRRRIDPGDSVDADGLEC